MFFICRFPFGTSEIKLKTLREVSDEAASEIAYFLKTFHGELNHNITNTSAYNFNLAQVGIPVFLKEEFIDFLLKNINYTVDSAYFFNPFKNPNEKLNLRQDFVFDSKSKTVTKLKDVFFDTSEMKKHYTIDVLSDYLLHEVGVSDFLITSDSINLARGGKTWEVNLKNQTLKEMVLDIQNESIIVEPYPLESTFTPRFGMKKEENMSPEYLLIQGFYSATGKALSEVAKTYSSWNEFYRFAKINRVQLGVIEKNDNIEFFKPGD